MTSWSTSCETLMDEPIVSDLVEQYVRRTVDDVGIYRDVYRQWSAVLGIFVSRFRP